MGIFQYPLSKNSKMKKGVSMEAEERIITSEFVSDDPDVTLRPKNFGDYVGQEKAKENLAPLKDYYVLLPQQH